jgi:hypothetical protein
MAIKVNERFSKVPLISKFDLRQQPSKDSSSVELPPVPSVHVYSNVYFLKQGQGGHTPQLQLQKPPEPGALLQL